MSDDRKRFLENLKNYSHLFENNEKVQNKIEKGTVNLYELIDNDDLLSKKIFNNFSDEFILSRINIEPELSIAYLKDKGYIDENKKNKLEESLRQKKQEQEQQKKQEFIDQIKAFERNNDYEKIKEIIEDRGNDIEVRDLYDLFEEEVVADIMGYDKGAGFEIDMEKFLKEADELPDPQKDRLDVFILGVPGSGKSCFLGGLLYYVYKEGRLNNEGLHDSANDYFTKLKNAIDDNRVPPSTNKEYINHLACTFKSYKKD